MSYCEHCQGQRFDRAQVLRVLRQIRRDLRRSEHKRAVDAALARALDAVRALEIPHLETADDQGEVVH